MFGFAVEDAEKVVVGGFEFGRLGYGDAVENDVADDVEYSNDRGTEKGVGEES